MRRGFVYRTTVPTSWAWIKWDVPGRLLPLLVAPVIYLFITGTSPAALGLNLSHPVRDLLLAVPAGLAGFAVAASFAEYLSRRIRRWFVPDGPDLALQSLYYAVLNAPIEEWFFRGFLQWALIRWWQSPLLGFLAASAVFGTYHFLGKWGWRPVAGTTVAGLGLGLAYLWQPAPPSLVLPVLIHAAMTSGLLSLGPFAIFHWRRARGLVPTEIDRPAVTA